MSSAAADELAGRTTQHGTAAGIALDAETVAVGVGFLETVPPERACPDSEAEDDEDERRGKHRPTIHRNFFFSPPGSLVPLFGSPALFDSFDPARSSNREMTHRPSRRAIDALARWSPSLVLAVASTK